MTGIVTKCALQQANITMKYGLTEAERLEKTNDAQTEYATLIFLGAQCNLTSENAFLPFFVIVEKKPEIASFKIAGEAFVEGSPHIIDQLITS